MADSVLNLMPFITSLHDDAQLYYRDYLPTTSPQPFQPASTPESSCPLVFTSAWPFSSKMYDSLLPTLIDSHRYRCILPDRRGYGKSEWTGSTPSSTIDYSVFASDLIQIIYTTLSSSQPFYGIGSSLGCGEWLLALQSSPQLLARCRGLVFIGSSLPIPLRTELKPHGPPREFWDQLLTDLRADRGAALAKVVPFIFRPDLPGNELSAFDEAKFVRMAEESDVVALERTVQAFLERDLTSVIESVGKMDKELEVLILHGGKDEVNPTDEGPALVKRYIENTKIMVYGGGAHGLVQTHGKECLRDMLGFFHTN